MAAFDRNGILIPAVGCIGDLILRDTLVDLSLQPDNVMTAGLGFVGILQPLKIIPVFPGTASGVRHIMDYDPIYFFQRNPASAVGVYGEIIFVYLRPPDAVAVPVKDTVKEENEDSEYDMWKLSLP